MVPEQLPPNTQEIRCYPNNLFPLNQEQTLSTICDHIARGTEQFFVPLLQQHDLNYAATIVQALVQSGALSSCCQNVMKGLEYHILQLFNGTNDLQQYSIPPFFETLSGSLLYVLSLLFHGETTKAVEMLQYFQFSEAENPFEMLLTAMLIEKLHVPTSWDPLQMTCDEDFYPEYYRGINLIQERSFDQALLFYSDKIEQYDDECDLEEPETSIAVRAVLHLWQGDLPSAHEDIHSLVSEQHMELMSYLLLALAHQWISSQSANQMSVIQ